MYELVNKANAITVQRTNHSIVRASLSPVHIGIVNINGDIEAAWLQMNLLGKDFQCISWSLIPMAIASLGSSRGNFNVAPCSSILNSKLSIVISSGLFTRACWYSSCTNDCCFNVDHCFKTGIGFTCPHRYKQTRITPTSTRVPFLAQAMELNQLPLCVANHKPLTQYSGLPRIQLASATLRTVWWVRQRYPIVSHRRK